MRWTFKARKDEHVAARGSTAERGAWYRVLGVDDRDEGSLGEARKHYRPREKLRWPVVVAPLLAGGEPAGASTLATTRGISVGGAFIETDGVFDVGTALHLWLHPPGPAPANLPHVLRLRAEVRWVNDGTRRDLPRGFGVEFRALTADDEIALHSYFSRAYKVV
jgi:hypothetical protein